MKKWEDYKDMDEAITDYIEHKKQYGVKLNRTQARKAIEKEIPLESKYQDKIINYLRSLPECIKAWKENKGTYSSMNGTPDITAVMKPGGVYFGFEVKRPLLGEPSDLQEKFIENMIDGGGHAYIVITVDEVKRILIREGIIHEKNSV